MLLRQAGLAADRLHDALRALPPAAYEPSEGDRERWARPVAAAISHLEPIHASASITGKELEAAVVDRRRAFDEFGDALVSIGGWLEATYRAAGCPERAAAVRPSRRRPGVLLRDEDRRRGAPAATGKPASSAAPAPPSSPTAVSSRGESPAAATAVA